MKGDTIYCGRCHTRKASLGSRAVTVKGMGTKKVCKDCILELAQDWARCMENHHRYQTCHREKVEGTPINDTPWEGDDYWEEVASENTDALTIRYERMYHPGSIELHISPKQQVSIIYDWMVMG